MVYIFDSSNPFDHKLIIIRSQGARGAVRSDDIQRGILQLGCCYNDESSSERERKRYRDKERENDREITYQINQVPLLLKGIYI